MTLYLYTSLANPRVNILAKSPLSSGGINSLEKNMEEIQFERKSKKLKFFLFFMDILFPMFDEFLHYFSSYLSNLKSFTQSHARHWKILCWKWKKFQHFSPFERLHEDFHQCWSEKNRKESGTILSQEGENYNFWPNIYPSSLQNSDFYLPPWNKHWKTNHKPSFSSSQ